MDHLYFDFSPNTARAVELERSLMLCAVNTRNVNFFFFFFFLFKKIIIFFILFFSDLRPERSCAIQADEGGTIHKPSLPFF